MDSRVDDGSLRAIAGRIRSGDLSPTEAVTSLLDRIERIDSRIHAWVHLDAEGALAAAREREHERADGRLQGPLHGVPIGIKDIFATAGIPTGMGSPFFEGHVPKTDAEVVGRLRKAGAIVLGKLVTSEFAALDPGPTRNPWNPDHTPGGSSSGSAAAVAAGMCPAATGTQTAGSIGRPAAYCGVVGFMPTAGRVPQNGVFPASWSLDHVGAFGRTVDDVDVLFQVMSDSTSGSPSDRKALRVGVLREFFEQRAEPAAWRHHSEFLDELAGSGVRLIDTRLPEAFGASQNALWTIMKCELATIHRDRYARSAGLFGPKIGQFIEEGLGTPALDYVRALRMRAAYQREMLRLFETCDLLISPGAAGPAPEGIATTGDPAFSAPWTLADFPTLSIPIGVDARGLPIGIQISAPPLKDEVLLDSARRVESVIGFSLRPAWS